MGDMSLLAAYLVGLGSDFERAPERPAQTGLVQAGPSIAAAQARIGEGGGIKPIEPH
ncbi:MAG: hypothetical protein AB7K64_01470 [Variibacter sp.]